MAPNDLLYQTHADVLPAAEFGWTWLGNTGRNHGADMADLIQLPKVGGIATAWKGEDLACYFVALRDPFNFTDIHCLDVMGHSDLGFAMQLHQSAEDAADTGDAWMQELITRRDVDIIDVNPNDKGAAICSAWRGRRLLGYYVQFEDPAGWTLLFCQEFNSVPV